jgi:FtsZ-binding cell division protein ZapB
LQQSFQERLASIIDKHDNRVAALNQEISSLKGANQQRVRKEEDLVKEVQSLKKQAQQWEDREKEFQKEIDRLTKKDNRNSK